MNLFLPDDQEIDHHYSDWVTYITKLQEKMESARIRRMNLLNHESGIRIISTLFDLHVKGQSEKIFNKRKVMVKTDWHQYKYDYCHDGVEIHYFYDNSESDVENYLQLVKLDGQVIYLSGNLCTLA